MNQTDSNLTEATLTMSVDELFELHPLPWSHHLLFITDANGRQVIHTGGLYSERGRLHEGKYLSGLNALLVELVNSRSSASAAPTVDRALYSELIHVAAELVRAEGFLSTYAEDMAPRLKRADILITAAGQERRLKDWAYRVRRVADRLSVAPASPAALQDEAKPQYDLDPLEFWCDLAEVLGHSRPVKADVPALVSEVKERLAVTTTKEKGDG